MKKRAVRPVGSAAVAHEPRMSTQTLQRRLTRERATFQQLIAEAPRELARHYIRHSSLELNETAYLLGYEDANSFFRACHQWEGTSPGEWRAQQARLSKALKLRTRNGKEDSMRYQPLGRTGLYVSELCLGAMTFGGNGFWAAIGKLGSKEAESLIGAAFDAGVNFIDTADVYSDGDSEQLVGAALAALGRPREQVVVATKVRGRVGPGVNQVGLSRAHILASIDGSLKRLGLDHVDLYQIHGFDPATAIEETVRALDDVVRSGKARYVGFSNLPAWQASKAITFAQENGLARFQSAQVYYSIAGRDIEREIAPLCQAEGVAILPWSPLAGGLLSGKFDPEKKGPADARRASFDFPPVSMERLPRVLGALRNVSEAMDVSLARIALAWQLTKPFVTSIIIGAKRMEQLLDNLAAVDAKLAPEHVKLLDEASALPAEYPGWMVDLQNSRDPRGQGKML